MVGSPKSEVRYCCFIRKIPKGRLFIFDFTVLMMLEINWQPTPVFQTPDYFFLGHGKKALVVSWYFL
jgi:hypothetical protein